MRIRKIWLLLFFIWFCSPNFCISSQVVTTWEEGFVDNGGVQIHYMGRTQLSTSPSLLFVPGLSMPAWIFEKQLQHFSKNYNVIAMDPRSQGFSSQVSDGQYAAARATDIKAVVDQLHLRPVILVGWSMACSEIVSYLDQFGSDGIVGVILIDGIVGIDSSSAMRIDMLKYWIEVQRNRPKNTCDFVRGMFVQPQSKEYIDRLIASSLITPTNTLITLVLNMVLTDLRPTLSAIKIPTLICTIRESWLENLKEMHGMISHSQLEVFENAGHALFVDQPDQFNAVVQQFIEQQCLS